MNLVSDVYLDKLIPIITKKLEVDLVQTSELFKEFIEINKFIMAVSAPFQAAINITLTLDSL